MSGKRAAVVLSLLLMVGVVAPAVGGVAGATGTPGFVSMSTTVDTTQPIVGEEFSITANITNGEDSSGDYEINRVVIRDRSGEEVERIAERTGNLGTIEPGESVEESVDLTLNETGTHDLELVVTLKSPTGFSKQIVQPVTVDVHDPHPQVEVSATAARPGEWRTVSVTVENGLTDPVRQVAVEVGGESVEYRDARKVSARVGAGGATTFEFPAKVDENGEKPVTVELSYTNVEGDRRTVTRTLETSFSERTGSGDHPQVSLDTATAVAGAWRPVNVTVANGLSEEVRQLSVEVRSEQVTFKSDRKVTASLGPGRAHEFAFTGRGEAGRHDVTVVLTYTTESGVNRRVEQTMTADFTPPDNPGRIRLTGVNVRPGPGGLQISGSASNVGSDGVQSVLVEVVDAENVEPAQPQPEFFVGEVEASDFISFDLNARLTNNRTSVPIRVTYLVDGVEKSYTTEVQVQGVEPARSRAPQDGGGRGGFAFVGLIVLVVALVGVLGVGYVGYRFVTG